jgi:hypothetical protein
MFQGICRNDITGTTKIITKMNKTAILNITILKLIHCEIAINTIVANTI